MAAFPRSPAAPTRPGPCSRSDLGERFSKPLFVAGLCVPDCAHVVNETGGGGARAWFFDMGSRSWAAVEFAAGAPDPMAEARYSPVHQSGARRLWDEVERSLTWWAEEREPDLTRFGLTVRPDGTTIPWLDDPANVLPFPRSAPGGRPRGGPR